MKPKGEKSMRRVSIFAVAVLILALFQSESFGVQSGTISCEGGIVSNGDSAAELLAKCGEPSYSLRREEKNIHRKLPGERTISNDIIDDWNYNFGPDRFQYRIVLTNGIVTYIESQDYGY
jgi:hypothetical protein